MNPEQILGEQAEAGSHQPDFTGSSQDPHSHGGSDPAPLFDLAEATRHCQTIGMELAQTRLRAIHWDAANMKVGDALDLPPGDKRRGDLEDLQRRGYRLYLIAGGGKEDKHVQSLSHCWAEWDGLEQQEVLGLLAELGAAGLPDPTLVLNTWKKGSIHVWWQLEQACTDVQRWRQLMGQLVLCLGSDRNCVNPSRLMRLAGSAYWGKAGKPHAGEHRGQARILEAETTEATCTLEELEQFTTSWMAAHPDLGAFVATAGATSADPPTEKERAEFHASRGHQLPPVRPLEHITALLDAIPQRKSGLPDGNYWKYPRHRLIACGLRDALYRLYRQGCTDDPDRDAAEHAEKDAIELMEQHSPSKECSWRVGQVVRSSAWLDEGNFWKVARHLDGFNLPPMEVPLELEPITSDQLGQTSSKGNGNGPAPAPAANNPKRRTLAPDEVMQLLPERIGNPRLNIRSNAFHCGDQVLSGDDVGTLYLDLSNATERWTRDCTADAVLRQARRNQFDPVAKELTEIGNTVAPLPLDQWQRLDQYLLGIDDPIAAAFLPQFFISAVARVFRPGCSVRRTPALIGKQWRGKTRLGRIIFGSAHWVENVSDLGKDDLLRLQAGWGVELSELNGITRRKDQEALKAFLTATEDVFRQPYGKGVAKYPRRCVFWATSNGPPLRDLSGSTRFVCIPVPDRDLPLDWAAEHRDAIWSRALELFQQIPADQEPWDRATEEERNAIQERNSNHQEIDPWAEEVERILADEQFTGAVPVKVSKILDRLQIPKGQQTNATAARVRQLAEQIGWEWARRRPLTGKEKRQGLWPPEPGHPDGHPGHPVGTPRGARANGSADKGSGQVGHPGHPETQRVQEKKEAVGGGQQQDAHAEGFHSFGVPGVPTPAEPLQGRGSAGQGGGAHRGAHRGAQPPPQWFEHLVQLRRQHPDALAAVLVNLLDPKGKWNVTGARVAAWLPAADERISQERQP